MPSSSEDYVRWPSAAAAPNGAPDPALCGRSWSVAALLLAANAALSARLGSVAVVGELTGFTRAASGHCYFSLKDADGAAALVRCAMFRRAAGLLEFLPSDGQRVEVRGRLALYEPRGDLQLVVESMRRQGAGSLYEEFLRLKAKLTAQGLFDPARRRSITAFPKVLAVVSSLAAAALQDVLTALARRAPHVKVVVVPCLVQGSEAPASIVQSLRLAAQQAQADTLLLVRGGGSLEDLWAFNDERVVRAVAESPVPVICGVGHETDVTLSDLAADLRAPTPTAAAELAAPVREEMLDQLQSLQHRLVTGARRTMERQEQRLDLLGARAQRPGHLLMSQRHRLDAFEDRLQAALRSRSRHAAEYSASLRDRLSRALVQAVDGRRWPLQALASRLESCNPRQILQRGYAWVAWPDGRPVTEVGSLQAGDLIEAVFADGQARAQVTAIERRKVH